MSTKDMSDRVCLITGATQGIGRAAAIEIARRGPTLVIVGRDPARTEEAVRDIKAQSGNDKVSHLLADLSSQAAVRKLAAEFKARHNRLHVLINNAGAWHTTRQVTPDGFEMTWAVNHLAYFLLTDLLLDVLKASAPARIVNVASGAHRRASIKFDDLQGEQRFKGFQIYGQSKLANILFTYELARRLQGTGVTANCLHPGVVSSGFGKNNHGLMKIVMTLASPFLITPEKGAETLVYLATSPEVEGVTGKYFARCREIRSNPESYDTGIAARLWEVTQQMIRT